MTGPMACHPSPDCCIRSNQLIALRFTPVVAKQAPLGPGNSEIACANFASRSIRMRGCIRGVYDIS